MCRGFRENETQPLRIRAFYTQLSVSCAKNKTQLPDFLTLHYLPRINGTLLEINGSRIRPDSPAFVTLHRVFSEEIRRGFSYGSRERVAVREGARFEIYAGDVKVLKGIFRKDEGENWKIDCKCVLSADDVVDGVRDAEVSVEAEGAAGLMTEKVAMVPAVRRRRGRCCELEEIPEEREGELGSDACGCCDCGGEEETDGGDCEMEMEMEMEGVRWALDVGIWVACIGVGLLVSRDSYSKRLRRKRFI